MTQPIPDPIFVITPLSSSAPVVPLVVTDLRQSRIDEFLLARSLSENSERAYRQDLKAFTDWTPEP